MRFFFRSRQFKIILSVVIAVVTLSVTCVILGGRISPQADILGTLTAPFKAAATAISNSVSDFTSALKDGNEAMLRNTELESEIAELREKLIDYEELKKDNEFYKNYLEIKENNPDFKFVPSTLISRDKLDPYKGFVINKGTADGIKENDTVITEAGLVGFISEAGLTTSKVSTVLSPDIVLGALDNRTSDSGIISGSLELSKEGQTKFFNLPRSCNISIGDYIVTSGEGIFPEGLNVGEIKSIGSNEYNTSIFAAIEPFADIDNLRSVMVITNFEGKGGLNAAEGK